MKPIVEDIFRFLSSPKPVPATLVAAHREFGDVELRFICITLASWWSRRLLLESRHPYLSLPPQDTWCGNLRAVVNLTPELHALVRLEVDRCWFADGVTRDEMAEINTYAQEHYNPSLFP